MAGPRHRQEQTRGHHVAGNRPGGPAHRDPGAEQGQELGARQGRREGQPDQRAIDRSIRWPICGPSAGSAPRPQSTAWRNPRSRSPSKRAPAGKLTLGGQTPDLLTYASAEGLTGTFGVSQPDVTVFELPLIEGAPRRRPASPRHRHQHPLHNRHTCPAPPAPPHRLRTCRTPPARAAHSCTSRLPRHFRRPPQPPAASSSNRARPRWTTATCSASGPPPAPAPGPGTEQLGQSAVGPCRASRSRRSAADARRRPKPASRSSSHIAAPCGNCSMESPR